MRNIYFLASVHIKQSMFINDQRSTNSQANFMIDKIGLCAIAIIADVRDLSMRNCWLLYIYKAKMRSEIRGQP